MNWLFSKKKTQPQVFVAEETDDGFSRISIVQNPYGPSPPSFQQQQRLPPYPTLPYDIRPPVPHQGLMPSNVCPYPPTPSYISSPVVRPPTSLPSFNTVANPLDSVPFKLADSLTIARSPSTNLEMETMKNNLELIRSRLQNLYDYDFRLEKSVIQEVSLSNGYCAG